jgi:hypothetical protein
VIRAVHAHCDFDELFFRSDSFELANRPECRSWDGKSDCFSVRNEGMIVSETDSQPSLSEQGSYTSDMSEKAQPHVSMHETR